MKLIFNLLLYLIFGTIRPIGMLTAATVGGRVMPVIVLKWRESWLTKPCVIYLDPLTCVVMLYKLDAALKNWDKKSSVNIEFRSKGLETVPIPAAFVKYMHVLLTKEANLIMKSMDDYDKAIEQMPEDVKERLANAEHPREALRKLVLVEEGVMDPDAVVVTNAPNTLQ